MQAKLFYAGSCLGSGLVWDAWSRNLTGKEIPGQSVCILAALWRALPVTGPATRAALTPCLPKAASTAFLWWLKRRAVPPGNLGPLCLTHLLSLPRAGDGAAPLREQEP